ncbi:hypothetical protein [Ktedonospora formicarum]|uniref:Uncharacterized protein n=1 Tax=Ktedonospora formicarum TaxID=2778364 RepID=A0A8J3HWY0_9CHLR|nr:hypothetical protein [Ktedonospora formicarum]GHO45617.1 hypothetical protein KSX_37800 [Ktedonospora formicarum]
MPERIAGPIEPDTQMTSDIKESDHNLTRSTLVSNEQKAQTIIIWTPRFMVTFALIAIIWLSAASLITQSWQNNLPLAYPASKILLIETILVFLAWCIFTAKMRAGWLRLGAIFGCAWGTLSLLNFSLQTFVPHLDSALISYLTTMPAILLLGSYTCLSAHRTALRRWDSYCIALLPLLAILIVLGIYLLSPADARSSEAIESWIGLAANSLGVSLWWLRPSCWKAQPGVSVLFGFASLLALLLSIPNFISGSSIFFLPQVALLCLLLGLFRIGQGEWRQARP